MLILYRSILFRGVIPSTTAIFGQKKDTPGNRVALLNEH